jgi:hypothetical protein
VLDEHENSNKENPRNGEPGCIYTIKYRIQLNMHMRTPTKRTRGTESPDAFIGLNIEYHCILNTIEYANSESSSLFFYNPYVERQLCIVNQGYAIVTEQQSLDRTNTFRSTL